MPTSTSTTNAGKLYAANARFAQRMLLLGLTSQQQFVGKALDLGCGLVKPLAEPRPADPWKVCGRPSAGPAWNAARRNVRYVGGVAAAAIDACASLNASLQEALGAWQDECSREMGGHPRRGRSERRIESARTVSD